MSEVVTSYYLRIRVADEAGVLAKITSILAGAGISIDALLQREAGEVSGDSEGSQGVPQTDLIILTHATREATWMLPWRRSSSCPRCWPLNRIRKEELN